ncbi:hypothetical protein TeGR_g14606 [Tetraparma gracilis]|uniref:Uncharacterized protein n=1 Tax=Tetraparma gracilis TaxID=2962635 RepID=A0ABQ6MRC0_9STRA|nr:hypothetical protein TeGR_g14606 [Tetraparma gracilis]
MGGGVVNEADFEFEWPYREKADPDDSRELLAPARGEPVGDTVVESTCVFAITWTRRGTKPTRTLPSWLEGVDLSSFGDSPGQPQGAGADLLELHEKAGWFRVELEKMLITFLKELGIDPQTEIAALDEKEKEKSFKAFTMASLKTMESCSRKMTDDYGGDHMRICDVVRCSIVVENEEQLAAVLKALVGGQFKGEGAKVTVVRLKNRFAVPMFTGIMDCLLNVLLEVEGQGGHVCEIQLHLAGILALKGYCHRFYEIFRDIFVGTAESYEKRLDIF